jgi:hypothetical protein
MTQPSPTVPCLLEYRKLSPSATRIDLTLLAVLGGFSGGFSDGLSDGLSDGTTRFA